MKESCSLVLESSLPYCRYNSQVLSEIWSRGYLHRIHRQKLYGSHVPRQPNLPPTNTHQPSFTSIIHSMQCQLQLRFFSPPSYQQSELYSLIQIHSILRYDCRFRIDTNFLLCPPPVDKKKDTHGSFNGRSFFSPSIIRRTLCPTLFSSNFMM